MLKNRNIGQLDFIININLDVTKNWRIYILRRF